MKKLAFLIGLLTFLEFLVFSQSNFRKGFLISTQGDTLRGYINCKEWNFSPSEFEFEPTLGKEFVQVRNLSNTRLFVIDGLGIYRQFITSISLDEVELSRLSVHMDTSHVTKSVFLKELVSGPFISLYSYTDRLKTRYYILEKGSTVPVELEYKIYAPNKSSVSYKKYVGQLMLLANKYNIESKMLEGKIAEASYTLKDMIIIVTAINGQKAENTVEYNKSKLIMVFNAGLGISRSYMRFKGDDAFAFLTKVPVAYKPSIAIGFTITEKPDARFRWHEALALSYLNYKIQSSENFIDNYYIETRVFYLKMNTITLASGFSYNIYNAEKFKFYLGTGLYLNASTYPTNYLFIKDEGQYTHTSYIDHNPYLVKKIWYSFPLKAGIILAKNYEMSFNWYLPSSLTRTLSHSGILQDIQVAVLYHFIK